MNATSEVDLFHEIEDFIDVLGNCGDSGFGGSPTQSSAFSPPSFEHYEINGAQQAVGVTGFIKEDPAADFGSDFDSGSNQASPSVPLHNFPLIGTNHLTSSPVKGLPLQLPGIAHFSDDSPDTDQEQLSSTVPTSVVNKLLPRNFAMRSKKRTTKFETDPTKLCRVCGDVAGRYKYYGAESCNSCRTFFHRTVIKSQDTTLRCLQGQGKPPGTCEINSKSRKSCKACRYDRCLKAGMKKELVVGSQYAREKEGREIALKLSRNSENLALDVYTEEEKNQVEEFVRHNKARALRETLKFFSGHVDVLDVILQRLLYGGTEGMTASMLKLAEITNNICISLFFQSEESAMIPVGDAQQLVKSNLSLVLTLNLSIGKRGDDFVRMMDLYREYIDSQSLQEDFGHFTKYFIACRKLASDKKIMQRRPAFQHSDYESLCHQVSAWFPRKADGEAMDIVPYYLMKYIYLYSTDVVGDKLRNVAATELARDKYVKMLYRYLRFNYGERGTEAFKEGLGMTSAIRKQQNKIKLPNVSSKSLLGCRF